MSFSGYPKYKRSGVEWLGEVPEHWDLIVARRLFEQRRDPAVTGDEQLSATQKYGVIPQTRFMKLEDQKVTLALSGTESFKHIHADDFVISLRSFQGGLEHSAYTGCVSPAYTVLRAREPIHARFWVYAFKSIGFIAELQSVTEGIRDGKNVSYEQFAKLILPHPSLAEQAAVAEFLDRATAGLDELIAEQLRLRELLKEKRHALIAQAVSKGLDGHAPMKATNIEWLGDVPAHWRLFQLARASIAECDGPFGSGLKSEHYVDSGARVVRLQNIKAGTFDDRDAAYIDMDYFTTELRRHDVIPGDVLVAGLGDDNNTVGRACVAPDGLGPALVKADCFRFRIDTSLAEPLFVALQLCAGANADAGVLASGSTRSRIPLGVMRSRTLALPPIDEQRAIVTNVARELSEMAATAFEGERAIALLQERRAALISAAVTGKIDVRGLAS